MLDRAAKIAIQFDHKQGVVQKIHEDSTQLAKALTTGVPIVTVLASNTATQAYEITRQQGEAGMGPPPHSHNWDESFYVVAGEVEFTCSGNTVVCSPGTLVHVPAGTVHSFRYLADGCDVLEITGQGGIATQMFIALSREIPPGAPEVPKLLEVLKQNGVTVQA